MLEDAAKQFLGIFSRRFVFNALLPTAIFMSLTLGVLLLIFAGTSEATNWWNGTSLLSQLLVAGSYLAGVLFVSAVVASQWRGIVRLFEGYPALRLARRCGNRRPIGTAWHRKRMRNLRDTTAPTYEPNFAFYRYPHSRHADDLLPSRLGNILLAGERYSGDRYGADAIIFWPRLYPLLPQRFQADYYAFIINYEFPLVVSFEAATATAICSVAALVGGAPAWVFIAVLGIGTVVSYAAYVASLSSAEDLAEQQRTAFDLFRSELIGTWPVAADVRDEKEVFHQIRDFVVFDANPAWAEPQGRSKRRADAVSVTVAQPPGQ
jgi:hypothetical protein